MLSKTPKKKGATVEEKRVLVGLPMDLFKALKHQAVERETTIKEIVAEALRKHLGLKGGESSKK